MAKKTEYDLLLAIMEIARGDSGAGGLIPLTGGKTVPVIRWRDRIREGNEPPIVACQVFLATRNTGAPEKLICSVQFDAVVPEASDGLEAQLIDRVEEVLTPQAFLVEGLDVDPNPGARRQLSPLEEGRRRLGLDFQMTMKR
jgi:hypothetical protein